MHAALKTLVPSLYGQICRQRLLPYLALLAPWIILRSSLGIGLVLCLCIADLLWIWRQTQTHLPSWLNAQIPELEDSAQLLFRSSPSSAIETLQSQRLHGRLNAVLTPARLTATARQLARQILPVTRFVLILSWVLALLVYLIAPLAQSSEKSATAVVTPALATPPQLNVRITPPAYIGQPQLQSEAKNLQLPEHSLVEWCLDHGASSTQQIRLSNGQELPFVARGQIACAQWDASETVFWNWSADAKQTRYTLKVILDQAPTITIKEPTELLQVLSTSAQVLPMSLQISDDYQIQTANLHLTLARGSGENIRFSDKEVPIPQGVDKRKRQWSKRWNLRELGMEPGDELYFFVRATDNAGKNPHIVTSPTYTIRLPSLEAAEEEVSVLPILVKPESLRSQRQIIIDTEQLLADIAANPRLNPNLVRNRSEIIANDQAALRRRYGRFLGEESSLFGDEHGDDHVDEQGKVQASGDLAAQYGHAHDQEESATLFDEATKAVLRRALAAMWDAEKALRAISPKAALAPENKALAAIKELQQADRIYLHKAAFTPPAIKEEKRYSGDVLDVKNKQRAPGIWEDDVPTEIRELLQALGQSSPLPALWTVGARSWIAQHIQDDTQRLQAQASVQDVADGCQPCRAVLAAWLRQGITMEGVVLQAQPVFKTKTPGRFEQRWHAESPKKSETRMEQQP